MAASVFELEFNQSTVAQAYVDTSNQIIIANEAFARFVNRETGSLSGLTLDDLLPKGSERLLKRHFIHDDQGQPVASRVEVIAESNPALLWQSDAAGVMTTSGLSLHRDDEAAFQAAFRAAREAETVFSATSRWIRPDGGYVWMHSVAAPVRSAAGVIERWQGCSVDVNDLMFESRERDSKLKDSQRRLDEMDGFVSLLANEVNAPARGVALAASFILEDAKNVDLGFTRKSIDLLQERSRQLIRIVDNLVAFSRLEVPRDVQRLKPEVIIEEVLKLLAPGRRTRVDVVRPLPEFDYSSSAFQQVMTNLIGNAVNVGAKNVMVRGEREANFVHFEVDDDGPGIPIEQQDKVFDLFHSTTPTDGHLGVGLAMVRKIAERSGGSVKVESVPGKGTVFHVRLPDRS